MIHYVEQIKVVFKVPGQSRVIAEAIEYAIRIEAFTARGPLVGEPPLERWQDARRNYHIRMILLQVVEQHVRNQIHAGPILFPEITEDRNSQSIHRPQLKQGSGNSSWVIFSEAKTRPGSPDKAKAMGEEKSGCFGDETCASAIHEAPSN